MATRVRPGRDGLTPSSRTRFGNDNIWLGVREFDTARAKRTALMLAVHGEPKPGIVYAATRRRVEEVAKALRDEGIRAAAYHAGMRPAEREGAHSRADEDDVIVATNAFGIGVDTPNVRFVFHLDMPDSVDAYSQEIGRAGRDGEPARAVLFYRPQDAGMRRAMVSTGKVLADLTKILHGLERAGAAALLRAGEVVPGQAGPDPDVAAARAAEDREAFRQYRLGRVELMRAYAETPGCRRRYLLNYFGEALEADCGTCDQCDHGASNRHAPHGADGFAIHARVRHRVFGDGTVMRQDGDSLVVLFDVAGSRKLALDHLRQHDLLRLLVR
jgi:ATP-dependent DNA helicase RecQ